MLIDRYPPEDVFARVPELADQTDPVLVQLDRLLEDDQLDAQVRQDLARRSRLTAVHGRHSTPADVLLRLLVVQHLSAWSYEETVKRVADALVLRWCCRVSFHRVPTTTTLLRWAATIQPATLPALIDRTTLLAKQAEVTRGRKRRSDGTGVQTIIQHPTDSGLLGDSVRVLARLIAQSKPLVQAALARVARVREALRSRVRSRRRRRQPLHRVRRFTRADADARQRALSRRLVAVTRRTRRQAQQVRTALQTVHGRGPAGGEAAGEARTRESPLARGTPPR
jgi:IS5 family transposase